MTLPQDKPTNDLFTGGGCCVGGCVLLAGLAVLLPVILILLAIFSLLMTGRLPPFLDWG
jgi:hypothetical protein